MVLGRTFREYLIPTKSITLVAPAILLILLLYFYVNGSIIFGELWSGFENVILLYVLILLGAFALAPQLLTFDPKAPLWMEAVAYIGPAIGINVIMILAGVRLGNLGPIAPQNAYAVIALQIAITGTEEMFFRGALWHRRAGPLISSALFAGFHAVAYGLNPGNLIFAFIAGLVFYMIYEQTKDQYGLAVPSGLHVGFNLGLLSVSILPLGLLGG